MKERQKMAMTVVLCCTAALGGFAIWGAYKSTKAELRTDPNCYETHPDTDVARTLFPVIRGPDHRGGLYACGLYSRPAMPDAIRCYELNRGCSK